MDKHTAELVALLKQDKDKDRRRASLAAARTIEALYTLHAQDMSEIVRLRRVIESMEERENT